MGCLQGRSLQREQETLQPARQTAGLRLDYVFRGIFINACFPQSLCAATAVDTDTLLLCRSLPPSTYH